MDVDFIDAEVFMDRMNTHTDELAGLKEELAALRASHGDVVQDMKRAKFTAAHTINFVPTANSNTLYQNILKPDDKIYSDIGPNVFKSLDEIVAACEAVGDAYRKDLEYAIAHAKYTNGEPVTYFDEALLEQRGFMPVVPKRPSFCLFCDDCQNSAIFSRGGRNTFPNCVLRSRHVAGGLGLSVILAAQTMRSGVPRALRLNSTHFILFKTHSRVELDEMYEEVSGFCSKGEFERQFNYFTAEPYGYMFADLIRQKVLYRKKKKAVKRKKTVFLKHKSVSRSQITKVNVRVGGAAAPATAPVVVSSGGGGSGGGSGGGGAADLMSLLPFLIPPQPPAPVATAPVPEPAGVSLCDMQAEDADTFVLPDYPTVNSAERGVQATPLTDASASQTLNPSTDASASQTDALSTAAVASQTRPPSTNAVGTQVHQSLTARGSQTAHRRMTHTGAQTGRPMTLNDGSTAPMLALGAPMQVDDALPHVPPGVAAALRDAVGPIQSMIADLQRGFGDASGVTRMIAQQQDAFGNSIIGENRQARREVGALFNTLRGELSRHAAPSGMPAGPVNLGAPGQLVVYQDAGDGATPDTVNFDTAAAVPSPPPAKDPAEVAAAAAAALEAMRAAVPAVPAVAPLPEFNAAVAMGPAPDAVPFTAPPKPKSKRVLDKLFHHLYHQGRTHGDATLIAAANAATDALKGDSPDMMALTMESLRLIKRAKELEVARQAFGMQEKAAADKDRKRKPPKTYIVNGTKTRAKARAESDRTKRAAKRDDNPLPDSMASITNSGADASNFFVTNGGTSITTAEIETRIARGEKPTMVAPPDKRARLALSVAQDAKRGSKPVLTRDLWKTSKRYIDQNNGAVAGNLTVGGTATVTGDVVFGTTVGAPGTAAGTRIVLYPVTTPSTGDYAIGVNSNTLFFNVSTHAKYSFCSGGTEVMAVSSTGAITGANLGGLLARYLLPSSQAYVNVSASTRYDVASSTIQALGSNILVEVDINYTTTGTSNAGLSFQWQSKQSAVYVASAMSTYAVCSYGPSYTTLSFNAVLAVTLGQVYTLAMVIKCCRVRKMVAIASFLPTASCATTGTVSISSASYIIPVSAINAVISGTGSIGTGDSAERLLYGLLQALYTRNQAGTITQPSMGCEIANKNITKSVWEGTLNNFANVNLVNFLVSHNLGTNALNEDASNLQVV
ncbi:hypothetical protein JKP88DRAFT_243299 [Tribonema minus]|uniref:Uncharacterized protein n=1 Tax=Tribonema minus TaxID=303371 RepID=A0A835ZBD4_9STRA|nr:hypothetical protein JKP88DRAFT_243299 [Tribonema minus]